MRFTINLATRTYLDDRVINRLAYSVVATLVVFAIWNVIRMSSAMGELGRLNADISEIQSKLGARPNGISEADFSRQKSRIRFYNEIIERKSTNWLNLLELFEHVTPDGIALSVLSPDKKPGEWKLEGHARSFKVVQQYLEKLESSNKFTNVLLISHQNMVTGERGRGVQFAITCKVLN